MYNPTKTNLQYHIPFTVYVNVTSFLSISCLSNSDISHLFVYTTTTSANKNII